MQAGRRRPLATRQTAWARALAQALVARRVSPNAISLAGMGFATLGAGAMAGLAATGAHPFLRALLVLVAIAGVQLRLLCNLLDGMVALEGRLQERGGDLFNEAPDRYADVVLLVGAGCALHAPALGWAAATGAILTAYVRAFGASLGQGQDFCGPFAKPQRMFWLTVALLGSAVHPPVLRDGLWLIALGSFLTAARRVVRLYRRLP